MTSARLSGIGIKGVRVCVPKDIRRLEDEDLFPEAKDRDRLTGSIGVIERRVAREGVTTSDLCEQAGMNLLAELGWAKDSIDVLIMVTQSPDYVIPATACTLQTRMGIGNCLAFDINLGCSGYPYGLWTAASLLKTLTVEGRPARALVLAGDISTVKLLKDDKATVPLFGDAGSATALEVDDAGGIWHGVFGTDGSGAEHIMVKAGAMRRSLVPTDEPQSPEEQAALYKESRLHLNGAEVFNFTLRAVPALAKELFETAGITADDVDYVVLHQANAFMLNHLRKKIGLPEEKVPIALGAYGNTSSASIPLAMASHLSEALTQPQRLVMMGFGVGWSWGAVRLDMAAIPAPKIDEYV
ncbi:ketoacyl-ACP synthase III [Asticcacaulis machinosus]|uniref:Ketoacyl-ACP synthase III n=1 Tax=Asticcacaulis machinosus TaxID=2984211 RepID=A0ABT5HLE5_9CAUL|nr:ketoacyl-ACP synthase III [Asticcacaulis machinosus]MDC7676960.1 ketoacyl-ACP synthase III [Asticcacaulis machinosus]